MRGGVRDEGGVNFSVSVLKKDEKEKALKSQGAILYGNFVIDHLPLSSLAKR